MFLIIFWSIIGIITLYGYVIVAKECVWELYTDQHMFENNKVLKVIMSVTWLVTFWPFMYVIIYREIKK